MPTAEDRTEAQGRPAVLPGMMMPAWSRTLLRGKSKEFVKSVVCRAADVLARTTGKLDSLTPPAHLRVRVGCFRSFIDPGRYRRVGEEFAAHLLALGGLRPGSVVLDIGCGCGQLASPLAASIDIRYEGVDPDAEAVHWCTQSIGAQFPKFRFHHVDLRNGYYNPLGAVQPSTWTMPFPDQTFDVIVLKSVFTHMLRTDVQHYLNEIARLLRRGGRCVASLYVLNSETEQLLAQGKADFQLLDPVDGGKAFDARTPEYIIGWHDTTFHSMLEEARLRPAYPVFFGSWCGRTGTLSYQDVAVLEHDDG